MSGHERDAAKRQELREEALRLSYMAESDLIEEYKLLRRSWERNPQLSAFASGVKAIRALREVVESDV